VREFPVRVLMNRRPCSECSGKVAAILTAVEEAKGDILVFADSDTVYPQGWLSCLVSLVSEDKVATTFPWPFPVSLTLRNALRSGFWTLGFESVFSRPSRFLWGGSMAFLKSFFTDNVKSALAKAWCDDCTLTALAKARDEHRVLLHHPPELVRREGLDFVRQEAGDHGQDVQS